MIALRRCAVLRGGLCDIAAIWVKRGLAGVKSGQGLPKLRESADPVGRGLTGRSG
jgi:hypothetical protein